MDIFNPTVVPTTLFKKVVRQVFTSSGTYTPTANMQYCLARGRAPGGGGGGASQNVTGGVCGGGGGQGAYGEVLLTAAQVGASQVVTIGAAGTGGNGTTPTNGTAGGDTSLGALLVLKGGGGGSTASGFGVFGGGIGGLSSSSTGDVLIDGEDGDSGCEVATANIGIPCSRGGAGRGNLGVVTIAASGASVVSRTYGCGGSPSSASTASGNTNGATGGASYIDIIEFVGNP